MIESLFTVRGRNALITGSNAGLGFAFARGLASAGARVVLNGRNVEKLNAAVATLRDEGLSAYGYAFDVTDQVAVQDAVERIEQEVGPLHILVNNAGIQRRMPAEEMTLDAWQQVVNHNLTGAFIMAQAVGRKMIPRGEGKIINICSLMSEVHRPTIANYSAAKGGLKMLTRALAVEWGKHNIQINGIGPGYFITEMTKPFADNPEFNAWICKRTPAGRWGRVEELLGALLFLAGPGSDFVNGQVVYVDGGVLAAL